MQTFMTTVENILLSTFSLTMLGFAAATFLMWGILNAIKPNPHEPSHSPDKPWMRAVKIAGYVLLPIFGLLFVASLFQIISMWVNHPEEPLALRIHYLAIIGFIGVLGGILGAVTAYIRIFTTERQTIAQETGLITDRINQAVQNLGADKTIKRQMKNSEGKLRYGQDANGELNYSKPVFEEVSTPNIEVRLGALYALERVAQDSLRDHIQIMGILTAYIRENAPASGAKPYPFKNGQPTPRTDIQATLTIIGRRLPSQIALERADTRQGKDGYRLDLSVTNLQSAKFPDLNFNHALLSDSRMEQADFTRAKIANTTLFGAHMERTLLLHTRMEHASLHGAIMTGACLLGIDLSHINHTHPLNIAISSEQLKSTFGSHTVILNARIPRPSHWPSETIDDHHFLKEWQKWLRNPTTYIPPQDRE